MAVVRQLAATRDPDIAQLLGTVLGLGDREVYVGITGTPIVVNGQLQLDPTMRIQVGNLRFTVTDVAQKLGVSEVKLLPMINQQVHWGQMGIQDVNWVGDRIQGVGKDG